MARPADHHVARPRLTDEQKAVHELVKLLEEGRLLDAGAADVAAAVADLLGADQVLAYTALADAQAACAAASGKGRDKCEKELDKAAKEWAKAGEELGRNHLDHAVDHYGKAWERAMKAIAAAG